MLKEALKQIPYARLTYRSLKVLLLACARGAVGFLQGMINSSPATRGLAFDTLKQEFVLAPGEESFVVSTRDRVIGREIYAKAEFDFSKFRRAIDLAGVDNRNGDLLFVDIGANIGPICIPVVKRGLAASALAIEPEPLNRKLLRANVILNNLEDRIEIIPMALGDAPGTAAFELSDGNFGDHRIKPTHASSDDRYGEAGRETVQVEMTTLDHVLETRRTPNMLLWMDTQGYEGIILKGAGATLERTCPMVLEFWPYGMKRSGSFDSLVECLSGSSYSSFVDLDSTDLTRTPIDRGSLTRLYDRLGERGAFTDILVQ